MRVPEASLAHQAFPWCCPKCFKKGKAALEKMLLSKDKDKAAATDASSVLGSLASAAAAAAAAAAATTAPASLSGAVITCGLERPYEVHLRRDGKGGVHRLLSRLVHGGLQLADLLLGEVAQLRGEALQLGVHAVLLLGQHLRCKSLLHLGGQLAPLVFLLVTVIAFFCLGAAISLPRTSTKDRRRQQKT